MKCRNSSILHLMKNRLRFILLFTISCYTQNLWASISEHNASSIDSLKQRLKEVDPNSDDALYVLSRIAEKIGKINSDTAERYVHLQLELARKLTNPHALARGLGNLGSLHERRGNYQLAMNAFMQMMHLADSLNDDVLRYLAYSELGNYFLDQKNYREAKNYSKKVLQSMSYKGDDNGITTMFNLGLSYAYLGQIDSARIVFEEGLREANKSKFKDQIGLHLSGLSMVEYYSGNADKGEQLVRDAIEIFTETQNKGQLLSAYVTLGVYRYQANDYFNSLQNFKRALHLAREVSSLTQEITIVNNLAVVSAESGDFEKGYYYSDTAAILVDSLNNLERNKAAKEMEARFELSNKERDISILKEKARTDAVKLAKQSQFNYALAAILLLSVVLLVMLWRNNRLRRRANKTLQLEKQLENQKRIELELANQRLMNENTRAQFEILKNQVDPHFMFNALNTLASTIRSDNHQAAGFVRALSILFRNMLDLKAEHLISLSDELKHTEAYLHLQKVRFGESLSFEITIEHEVAIHKHIPPFSLQQVVENAIKHNRIFIKEPLHIKIDVNENNVMVSNKINLRNNPIQSTHTGLANIRARYSLLHDVAPEFIEIDGYYIAKLPLLE